MKKQIFLKIMNNISVAYPTSKIDTGNDLMMSVWYDVLKSISDEDFISVVKMYLSESKFAPLSPASILEFANEKLINHSKSDIDKVWIYLKDMIVKYGFNSHYEWSSKEQSYVAVNYLNSVIKNHGDAKLLKTYDSMYSKLTTLNSNNEDFVRKEFFEIYEQLIVEETKSNTAHGKIDNKKVLEIE